MRECGNNIVHEHDQEKIMVPTCLNPFLNKKEVYAVKGSWMRGRGAVGEGEWAAHWGLCFLGLCLTSSQKEVQTESTLCGPRTLIGSFRPRNGEIGQAKWVRSNFVKIVDDFPWFWIHPCSWIIFLIMTWLPMGLLLSSPPHPLIIKTSTDLFSSLYADYLHASFPTSA